MIFSVRGNEILTGESKFSKIDDGDFNIINTRKLKRKRKNNGLRRKKIEKKHHF